MGLAADGGRRTGAMSDKVFYGRTDGRTDGRTTDKKRRKNFVLGSPYFLLNRKSTYNYCLIIVHVKKTLTCSKLICILVFLVCLNVSTEVTDTFYIVEQNAFLIP